MPSLSYYAVDRADNYYVNFGEGYYCYYLFEDDVETVGNVDCVDCVLFDVKGPLFYALLIKLLSDDIYSLETSFVSLETSFVSFVSLAAFLFYPEP